MPPTSSRSADASEPAAARADGALLLLDVLFDAPRPRPVPRDDEVLRDEAPREAVPRVDARPVLFVARRPPPVLFAAPRPPRREVVVSLVPDEVLSLLSLLMLVLLERRRG